MRIRANAIKLSELVVDYLAANKRLEPSTVYLTRMAFKHLIIIVGDIKLKHFSYDDAEKFQAHIIQTGKSEATANIYVKTVKPIFNWAVRRGLIAESPFTGLKLLKVGEQKINTFTDEELQRILFCCDDLWKARVLCGRLSMRKGEVLNLTRDDVDFKQELIYIQPKREGPQTWQWKVKGKHTGILPLIPLLSKLLLKLSFDLPPNQPYLLIRPQRYKYLMGLKQQGLLSYRLKECPDGNFTRKFKLICRNAIVPGKTFHDLRKTAITGWATHLHFRELQKLARHSDIKTTMKYYVAIDQQAAVDKIRQTPMGFLDPGSGPMKRVIQDIENFE